MGDQSMNSPAAARGWQQLLPTGPLFHGPGRFPIDAYSEFMPPPRFGWHPYHSEPPSPQLFDVADPLGWYVSEYEEANEIVPGLEQVAGQLVNRVWHLLRGETSHAIPKRLLENNVYWPDELARRAGTLSHERGLTLAPLALSRTQDDKGRVRWTLFGVSEQGPAKGFWKSFQAPQVPADQGPAFICGLLRTVYGETVGAAEDLLKVGFRILEQGKPLLEFWKEDALPEWAVPFCMEDSSALEGVKYLLTFRPFSQLPEAVRQGYLGGTLHLLPSPASLVFWGIPRILRLHQDLPLGLQVPLLQLIARHREPRGLRVPQAGLFHAETGDAAKKIAHPELVRNTFKRTHRWDKILRDQDELALLQREDKLLHVLFSSIPEDVALYDKPMARNVQIWAPDGELLLDGPTATPEQLKHAMRTTEAGGIFGYRFQSPAMRVGMHEVYWHRPLAAYHCPVENRPKILADVPLGYLTAYPTEVVESGNPYKARSAYRVGLAALAKPVELWPRLHAPAVAACVLAALSPGGQGPNHGPQYSQAF